jgi:hypothetical protein
MKQIYPLFFFKTDKDEFYNVEIYNGPYDHLKNVALNVMLFVIKAANNVSKVAF